MTNINVKVKADETAIEDDLPSSTNEPIILPGYNIVPWRLIQQLYFNATKLRSEEYREAIRELDNNENPFSKKRLDEFFRAIYGAALDRNTRLETLAHLQLDELKYRIPKYLDINSQDKQQIVNFHDFYSRKVERKFVDHLAILDKEDLEVKGAYSSRYESKRLLAGFENSRLHINHLANNQL